MAVDDGARRAAGRAHRAARGLHVHGEAQRRRPPGARRGESRRRRRRRRLARRYAVRRRRAREVTAARRRARRHAARLRRRCGTACGSASTRAPPSCSDGCRWRAPPRVPRTPGDEDAAPAWRSSGGGRGYVRDRLESPAVLTRGDPFHPAAYSPSITIGGGWCSTPSRLARALRTESRLAPLRRAGPQSATDDGRGGAARWSTERGAAGVPQARSSAAGSACAGGAARAARRASGCRRCGDRRGRRRWEVIGDRRAGSTRSSLPSAAITRRTRTTRSGARRGEGASLRACGRGCLRSRAGAAGAGGGYSTSGTH